MSKIKNGGLDQYGKE